MQIRIKNIAEVINAFRKAEKRTNSILQKALGVCLEEVRTDARIYHRWKVRTGRSIKDIKKNQSGLKGIVFLDKQFTNTKNNVSYLAYLHEGWDNTNMVIRPTEKKALRWVSGDSFVFAKSKKGNKWKGDEFLFGALVMNKSFIQREFDKAVSQITEEL